MTKTNLLFSIPVTLLLAVITVTGCSKNPDKAQIPQEQQTLPQKTPTKPVTSKIPPGVYYFGSNKEVLEADNDSRVRILRVQNDSFKNPGEFATPLVEKYPFTNDFKIDGTKYRLLRYTDSITSIETFLVNIHKSAEHRTLPYALHDYGLSIPIVNSPANDYIQERTSEGNKGPSFVLSGELVNISLEKVLEISGIYSCDEYETLSFKTDDWLDDTATHLRDDTWMRISEPVSLYLHPHPSSRQLRITAMDPDKNSHSLLKYILKKSEEMLYSRILVTIEASVIYYHEGSAAGDYGLWAMFFQFEEDRLFLYAYYVHQYGYDGFKANLKKMF